MLNSCSYHLAIANPYFCVIPLNRVRFSAHSVDSSEIRCHQRKFRPTCSCERTTSNEKPNGSSADCSMTAAHNATSEEESESLLARTTTRNVNADYRSTDDHNSSATSPLLPKIPAIDNNVDQEEDEIPTPELSPIERRNSLIKWVLLWSLVAVMITWLTVQAVVRGGAEFDWKGALKKAGGGGLAGAMAMIIQVLSLMPLRTVMSEFHHQSTRDQRYIKSDRSKRTSRGSERSRSRLVGLSSRRS
jgi:uncharacterized membrane protein